MATVAREFSTVEVGASTVPGLARRRDLGAHRPDPARAGPPGTRAKGYAHRGDSRFAVGQDGAKRGRRGYDAGKKIKGRKRHIAVDTPGNLLALIVHSAGIQDRVAARGADAALLPLRYHCHRLRRWRLYGQADRLGKRHVPLPGGSRQTQRTAPVPRTAEALDRRAYLRLAGLVAQTL